MQGIIEKKDFDNFISTVKEDYKFYGPVNTGDYYSLVELESARDLELDYPNLKVPPKELFFPQCEVLYKFEGDEIREVPRAGEKAVVFGIRPCDARAVSLLDKVFGGGEFEDPYYIQRRRNAVLVSMACLEPREACFCTSVGGGPFDSQGADIVACELGEGLLLESFTENGEKFMKTYADFLKKPADAELKERDKLASVAEKKLETVNLEGLKEKLEACFESPFWDSAAQSCVGCAVCTYFCPTCHCFALFDEKVEVVCAKERNWDSCQFPAFTREASGHNPRSSQGERMRQRIMHKFHYAVENFQEIFCVGCGRCVTNCPVNVDIREILAEVTK